MEHPRHRRARTTAGHHRALPLDAAPQLPHRPVRRHRPAPRPRRMDYCHALHHRQRALAPRPRPHGERGAMACGGTGGAGQFVELFADLVDGPLLFALRVSYPYIVVSVDRRGPQAWTCGTRSAACAQAERTGRTSGHGSRGAGHPSGGRSRNVESGRGRRGSRAVGPGACRLHQPVRQAPKAGVWLPLQETGGRSGRAKCTSRTLRDFFAPTALANGVPICDVSRQLGHRSIKVTVDIYGHPVPCAWHRCQQVLQNAMWSEPLDMAGRPSSEGRRGYLRASRVGADLFHPC
jgi:hypothetical protein